MGWWALSTILLIPTGLLLFPPGMDESRPVIIVAFSVVIGGILSREIVRKQWPPSAK